MTTTAPVPVRDPGHAAELGPTADSAPPATVPPDVRAQWRVMPAPRYEPDPVGAGGAQTVSVDPPAVRPRPPVPAAADGMDVEMRQFAIGAIKLVLEVLNRRRPVAQLSAVAVPHIIDQFRALLMSGPDRGAPPATLLRVHTQSVRPDAAEITVVYSRGSRVLAMGARVERRRVVVRTTEPGTARRRERRYLLVAVSVG